MCCYILKKYAGRNKFTKSRENHLMYMNDILIFVKNEKEPETLIQ